MCTENQQLEHMGQKKKMKNKNRRDDRFDHDISGAGSQHEIVGKISLLMILTVGYLSNILHNFMLIKAS